MGIKIDYNIIDGKFMGIPTFKWKGLDWICRPLWGIVHKDDIICYTDTKLPRVLSDDTLLLPIQFDEEGYQGRHFARGLVRSVKEFKYGTFEWEVILPCGEYVWPALWLSSDYSWPPEIDALEGWSANSPNYVKRVLFKNIKPTMHWSEEGNDHAHETKDNILRCIIKGDGKVNKIKVVWTASYVDVFYNGIKIKRFKDQKMLDHMNKPEIKMHAIMSTNVYGDPWLKAGTGDGPTPIYMRDMQVKSFKYYPL